MTSVQKDKKKDDNNQLMLFITLMVEMNNKLLKEAENWNPNLGCCYFLYILRKFIIFSLSGATESDQYGLLPLMKILLLGCYVIGLFFQFKCCGVNDSSDWRDVNGSRGVDVPDSCCNSTVTEQDNCGAGQLENPTHIYTGVNIVQYCLSVNPGTWLVPIVQYNLSVNTGT